MEILTLQYHFKGSHIEKLNFMQPTQGFSFRKNESCPFSALYEVLTPVFIHMDS